jgi:hypothetical protein
MNVQQVDSGLDCQPTLKRHRAVPLRESIRLIPVGDMLFIIEQLARFLMLVAAGGKMRSLIGWA